MRCLIVALLLCCTGCYDFFGMSKNLPDPFEAFESTDGCLGPWRAAAGHKLNGDAIRNNEALLKQLFKSEWSDEHGNVHPALVNSSKDFCERFGGITITYLDVDQFPCAAGQCWGYNDSHGITLERYGRSLAHELTHSYELEHLIFNTATHPRWDAKGYYSLETLYQSAHDLNVCPDCLPQNTPGK